MQTRANFGSRRRSSATAQLSTEARLLKLQRKVNALDPELKCSQASGSLSNVSDTTGSILYLSGIAAGTTVQERVGEKIHVKQLNLNVKLVSDATTTITSTAVYGVYLIKDVLSNGVVPTISGGAQAIFLNPGPTQAMINPSTKDRFKIIRKFVYGGGMAASGSQNPLVSFKVKLNHAMDFQDNSAAQTGAGKNSYYLVILTDDTADQVDFATFREILFTDA